MTWHVENIKLSHIDGTIVTKVINWLTSIYGEDMIVSKGKVHDCLRMKLGFTTREVKVIVVDYLKMIIHNCP
jgi:hypothetical protein